MVPGAWPGPPASPFFKLLGASHFMYLRNIPMTPFCNPTHHGLLHLTAKRIPALYLNPDFPYLVPSTEKPQLATSKVALCPPWGSRVIILVVELSPKVLAPES